MSLHWPIRLNWADYFESAIFAFSLPQVHARASLWVELAMKVEGYLWRKLAWPLYRAQVNRNHAWGRGLDCALLYSHEQLIARSSHQAVWTIVCLDRNQLSCKVIAAISLPNVENRDTNITTKVDSATASRISLVPAISNSGHQKNVSPVTYLQASSLVLAP